MQVKEKFLSNRHYSNDLVVLGFAVKTIAQINSRCNPVISSIDSTFIPCSISFHTIIAAIACINNPFFGPGSFRNDFPGHFQFLENRKGLPVRKSRLLRCFQQKKYYFFPSW
jgi:hypothetical protein